MSENKEKDAKLGVKNFQTYSLLQMKMKEVEKTKKVNTGEKSSSKPKERTEKAPESYKSKEENMEYDSSYKQSKEVEIIPEENTDPNEPDRSFGDLYCKTCDSHMNSEAMWEAHVTGKKHTKNVKKGINESKYEDLPDEESSVKYELRNVKDPIIGLNYIEELRKFDPAFPPLYNCYLCHSNLATLPLLIEHIISAKHQLNFMRENKPKEYQLIQAANLKKGQLEPLVAEKAALLEEEYGRGNVIVKKERKSNANARKRNYDSDEDYGSYPKKANKTQRTGDSGSSWGGLDTYNIDSKFDLRDKMPKKSYFENDDHSRPSPYRDSLPYADIRSSVRSTDREREEHFRRILNEDYPKRSSSELLRTPIDYPRRSYPDDHLKSTDLPKDRLQDRYMTNILGRTDGLYSSSSHHDSLRDLRSLYQDKLYSNSTPSTSSREERSKNSPPKNPLKDFINQLFSMSQEYFLKIALMKLKDALESKQSIGRSELDILAQIYDVTRKLICKNLPPGLQTLFGEKSTPLVQNTPVAPSPAPQTGQFSISDITDLLVKARQSSEPTKSLQAQQPFTQNIPTNTGNIAGNFPSSNNFPRPTGAEDLLHNTYLKPADNLESKFGLGVNFSGPPRPAISAASGNFRQPDNFSTLSSNSAPMNYQQPNNFPAPLNSALPSSNFHPSNFSSLNPSRGYPPYNNPPSVGSIPGLSLAGNESPQKPPFNNNFLRY